MANQRHVDMLLHEGVEVWNLWRAKEPGITPNLDRANLDGADLSEANLGGADLSGANLSGADLSEATLGEAGLTGANLTGANLTGADLTGANLTGANLTGANLSETELFRTRFMGADLSRAFLRGADFSKAFLSRVNLSEANLSRANLSGANLSEANLSEANLSKADLKGANLILANLKGAALNEAVLILANLSEANLSRADLSGANLSGADLSGANLSGADLIDCAIYRVSAWDVNLQSATQKNLRITPPNQAAITVDNLEVAQFLYLLLHNEKARVILDTITSKVVLILGRFGEHKAHLDAVREALRSHPNGYIPVLFDFDPQAEKPILETVKILANLARFVIADLTDPRMVRAELTAIIPNVPTVPVQPIVEGDAELPTEYASWALYRSFLPLYRYADLDDLLVHLTSSVIEPVEGHVQARRLSGGSGSQA